MGKKEPGGEVSRVREAEPGARRVSLRGHIPARRTAERHCQMEHITWEGS